MLEVMMEGRVPYVLMGILTVIGIWSKIVVHVSLKRLVGAAGSMNKSNHPLMRLVKAKFEPCLYGQRHRRKCRRFCGQVSV